MEPLDKNFISTKEAAEISGYNPDYLARLCRAKKISGTQVGRTWLISQESLEEFVKGQGVRRKELRDQLSEVREKEYKHAQSPVQKTKRVVTSVVQKPFDTVKNNISNISSPFGSADTFQKKAVAVLASLVVMLGAVTATEAAPLSAFAQNTLAATQQLSNTIHTTAANAANTTLAFVSPANPIPAMSIAASTDYNAYVAMGDDVYGSIGNIFSGVTFATQHPATAALAVAYTPANITQSILQTYDNGVNAWVTITPAVPLATMQGLVNVGSTVGTAAGDAPQVAVATFNNAIQSWVTTTPLVAEKLEGGYLALGTGINNLGSGAADVETTGATVAGSALYNTTAQVGATTAQTALALVGVKNSNAVLAAVNLGTNENPLLDTVGYSINSFFQGLLPSSLYATSSQFALATYNAINGLFGGLGSNVTNYLAFLFTGKSQVAVVPNMYTFTESSQKTPYTTPETVGTVSITSQTSTQTTTTGTGESTDTNGQLADVATQQYVQDSIGSLKDFIIQQIEAATVGSGVGGGGGGGGGVTNTQSFTGFDNIAITGSTFSGGSINTGDLSAGSTTLDSLAVTGNTSVGGGLNVTGDTTLATTTTGNLTINGDLTLNGTTTLGNEVVSGATFTNATTTNFVATNATTTNLFATLADITNGTINNLSSTLANIFGLTTTNATSTNASSTNFYASNSVLDNLFGTVAQFATATINNLFATNFTTTNATSTNATSTNLYATNGTLTNITTTNGTITNGAITNATLGNAAITNSTTTNATSTNLYALNANLGSALINALTSNSIQTGSLLATGSTTLNTLAIGSLNGVLQAANGYVTAGNVDLTSQVENILPVANGGTGFGSYSPGIVLVSDAGGNLIQLAPGTPDQVLKINPSGVPFWGTDETVGGGGSDGIFATSSDKIYPIDTTNVFVLGSTATSSKSAVFEVHGNSYFSNNVGIGSTSPLYALSVEGTSSLGNQAFAGFFTATSTHASTFPYASTTGLSISSNNGFNLGTVNGLLLGINGAISAVSTSSLNIANVNPSLNGFLKATAGALSTSLINLTSDVSGTLPVANGGTGTTSFASNGVVYGNGTSGLLATTQGAANTVLVANGGAPSFSNAIDVGVSITSPSIDATSRLTVGSGNGFLKATSGLVGEYSAIDLTTDVTNTLPVANGGTGSTTLTGLLKGNGTGGIQTAVLGIDYLAPNSLSAGSGIGYNSGTGVISNTGVLSVSNSDGSLSISPTTGAVVASLNTAHANSFTALQQFLANASTTELTTTGNTFLATGGGNVGVGTTNAQNLLQIGAPYTNSIGGTASGYALQANGSTLGADIEVSGSSPTGLSIENAALGTSGYAIDVKNFIGTAPSDVFNVTWNGNVGIGTSTPGATLAVAGNALITGNVTVSSLANGLLKSVNGVLTPAVVGTDYLASTSISATYPILDTAGNFSLAFGTTTANTWSAANNFTSTLALASSSPWGQLSINPNGIVGPSFVIGSSTGTSFIVTNGGAVGIGTTSPSATFSVAGQNALTAGTNAPLAFLVQGGTGLTTGAGGGITLAGGIPGTSGLGGGVTISGGSAAANTAFGSSIIVNGGNANTGAGGGIAFTSGSGNNQTGGFTFTGGNVLGTNIGSGGGFTVTTGNAGSTGSGGGNITLTTGWGGVNGGGGSFLFTAGNGTGQGGSYQFNAGSATSSGAGGGFAFAAGNASTTIGANAGGFTFTGGNGGTNVNSNGNGGSITLNGGAAGTAGGTIGNILLATLRGNVGIGTTSPSQLLSVQGGALFSGNLSAANLTAGNITATGTITTGSQFFGPSSDSATAPSFTWTGDANTGLFHVGADALGFSTGGTERARIDSSGNFTIDNLGSGLVKSVNGQLELAVVGTDYLASTSISATYPIVDTAGNFSLAFGTTTANTWSATNNFTSTLALGSTTPWGLLSINPTSTLGAAPAFVIGSSTGTSFLVTNGGNVGVGTTSPSARFSILGASATSGNAPLALLVQGGVGGTLGFGGGITLQTGNGGNGAAGGNGATELAAGNLNLTGGVGGLNSSAGSESDGNGGGLNLTGGVGGATSVSGNRAGTGGAINIIGGNGGVDTHGGGFGGSGGSVLIAGGIGGTGTFGNSGGGSVILQPGLQFATQDPSMLSSVELDGPYGTAGGDITLTTGNSGSTSSTGGAFTFQGGDGNTGGGGFTVTGGNATSTGNGGSITLNGGTGSGVGGTAGNILLATLQGNVGIGTTSPWQNLSVAGNLALTGGFFDSTAKEGTNGQLLLSTGSATVWTSTSTLGLEQTLTPGTGIAIDPYGNITNTGVTSINSTSLTVSPTTGAVNININPAHSNTFTSLQTFNSGLTAAGTITLGSGNGLFYGASGILNTAATSTPTLGLGLGYSGTLGSFVGGTSGSLSIATSSLYSGTTGQVAYFSGTNTLKGNSNLIITAGGNVGIGTTSPWQNLSINGGLALTGGFFDSTASEGTAGQFLESTGSATQWTSTSTLGLEETLTPGIGIAIDPYGNITNTGVTSINSTSLTVSPTTGAVNVNINPAHSNTFTSLQTFNSGLTAAGAITLGSGSGLFYGTSGVLNNVATSTPTLGLGLGYSGTLGSFAGGTSGALSIATSSLYSGTAGQAAYFSATNTLTATSSLFIATSGKVGIGTTSPAFTLDVGGNIDINPYSGYYQNGQLLAYGSTTSGTVIFGQGGAGGSASTTNLSSITAIGNGALAALTTGLYNTGVGNGALAKETTGQGNVALGVSAILKNVVGNDNIGVGQSALQNVLGSGNTALGYNTMANLSAAGNDNYNTTLGFQAGQQVQGDGNVLIGATPDAGINNVFATGENNIELGDDIVPVSTSFNNTLNIGNVLFGTIPATTTLSSTFALPTTGSIGIATATPYATLSVQANNGSTNTTVFAVGSTTASKISTLFSIGNQGNAYLSGNFGIGTSTPGSLLSLSGIANFTTATSTFYSTGGLNLSNGGCYAINGTCLSLGSFAGTLGVANGGTGSTTLSGILKGNATGSLLTAVGDVDYQNPITLTTTGTSGAATFSGDVLNVPQYSGTTYTASYPVTLTGSTFGLAFGTTTANSWSQLQQFNGNASSTELTVTGSTYLATASGNVGIGTTSPSQILSVQGSGLFLSNITAGGTITATNLTATSTVTGKNVTATSALSGATLSNTGQANFATNGWNDGVGPEVGIGFTGSPTALLDVYSSTAPPPLSPHAEFMVRDNQTSGSSPIFSVNTYAFGDSVLSTPNTYLGTYSGTQVGVGTTSPFAKLSVQAQNGDTANTLFAIGSSTATATTTLFSVTNTGNAYLSGNFGIGTSSPFASLSLVGANGTASGGAPTATNPFLYLVGGKGGLSTPSGSNQGATGAAGTIIGGAGGDVTSGLLFAGAGGSLNFTGGVGGNATTGGVGGFGGNVNITGGAGGAGSFTGAGGNVFINAGAAAGTGSANGTVFLISQAGLANAAGGGNLIIGTSTNFVSQTKVAISANAGENNLTLFEISSSTASANTTLFTVSNTGVITSNALATSTFASGLNLADLNITGSATSTAANGINLTAGCFSVNGTCITSGGAGGTNYFTNTGALTYLNTGTQAGFPYFEATSTTATSSIASNLTIGTANPNYFSTAPLVLTTNVNSYGQAVLQNLNNGSTASADFIVGADLMTNSSYYGDLGYNSSGNADPNYTGFAPNDLYLYNSDSNVDIAAASSTGPSAINFFTGGTLSANLRATISSAGNFGIGTSTPGSLLSLGGIANFTTATSSFYGTGGINLTNGCFAVNGTCVGAGGGGGSGTVNSGTTGQYPYYAANGTTLTATSTLFLATTGNIGIGSTSPNSKLVVAGTNPIITLDGGSSIDTIGNVGSALTFNTVAGNSMIFDIGGSERFRIASDNNVGVASSTPFSLFSVGTLGTAATTTLISDLNVGLNGISNPAFQVLGNIASAATGIQIVPAAAGSGVSLNTISSGTNEALSITAKGTGNLVLGAGFGAIVNNENGTFQIKNAGSNNYQLNSAQFQAALNSATSASTVRFGVSGAADTNLTLGTESPDAYFNFGQTRQHAGNTAIALQRDFRITGSTHSFITSGGTITTAAAFSVDGPDSGGTNATISTSTAIYLPTSVLSNVTTGIGLYVEAPTGATNNYAAVFMNGNVGIGTTSPYGLLSVNPTAAIGTAPEFVVGSSTGTSFKINNDGSFSLGIGGLFTGTTAGQFQFTGNGNINAFGSISASLFGPNTQAFTPNRGFYASAANVLNFSTNGLEALRITGSQFIGVGTTTPFGQLSASSTSAFPALAIQQNSTGPAATFLGGNVGIGSSSPYTLLSVGTPGTAATTTLISDLVVGLNGGTNPAFQVLGNIASAATGVEIVPAAAGSGVSLLTTSSGTNEGLTLSSKGTANLILNGAPAGATNTGGVFLEVQGLTRFSQSGFQTSITPTTNTSAATTRFSFTGAADTALTAGTEALSVYFNIGQTRQHASNTAIALQRDFRITGATHSFATAGGTITTAAAFSIDGPDSGGTNATISTSTAIYLPQSTLANVTTGIGLYVEAPTGATNNFAAVFNGTVALPRLAVPAGSLLAVDANGNVIATSTPAGVANYFTNSGSSTYLSTGTNFGIGTSTPGSLLSIGGVANFTTATSTFYSSGGINITSGCYAVNGVCLTGGGGGSFTNTLANGGTATTTFYAGGLVFSDGSKLTQAADSGSDVLNWDNVNGFLGIGTTTPEWQLSVQGTSGIHVKTTTNIASALGIENAQGTTTLQADTLDNANSIFSVATSTGNTYFFVGSNGNIGIGTTTPTSGLAVGGLNGLTVGNDYEYAAPTNGALIEGAVGIGTTTVNAGDELDVNGPEFINGNSSTVNFSVGNTGVASNAFQVDQSGGMGTGLSIQTFAAGTNGVILQALSTATNDNLAIDAKGTGNVTVGATTNTTLGLDAATTISFQTAGSQRAFMQASIMSFTPAVSAAAANFRFGYTGAADTALTAGTEAPSVYFNIGQTRQHASNTTIALQRDFRITGATHSFASSGGIITTAAAFSVDGPDNAGTNATIGTSTAIYVPTLALTGTVTNGVGLDVFAPTGATNNYAAIFQGGNVGIGSSSPSSLLSVGTPGVVATTTLISDLVVGLNGSSNPAFQVLGNVTSAATGLEVIPAASGSGVTLGVTSPGTNEAVTILAKGAGGITASTNGGNFLVKNATGNAFTVSTAAFGFAVSVSNTASHYSLTGAADTAITAGTEVPVAYFNFGQTRTHASNTTVPLERDFRITGATYAFATAGGTLTTAAAFSVDGPDSAGTNATIGTSTAIYVPSAALTGTVTSGVGLDVFAPTGATNNYAAIFQGGNVGIGTSTPVSTLSVTGSLCVSQGAGSASVLCGTAAGNEYATAFNTGAYDVAENYLTNDPNATVPGTIVALDIANGGEKITTAMQGSTILGVVSSNPGIKLGGSDAETAGMMKAPVALSGRIPVQVDMEGGPIAIGDRIALSSTPGVGMKATQSGQTVGIALQAASAAGKIDVFVQPQYYFSPGDLALIDTDASTTDVIATSSPTSNLTVNGDISAVNVRASGQGIFGGSVAAPSFITTGNVGAQTLTATGNVSASSFIVPGVGASLASQYSSLSFGSTTIASALTNSGNDADLFNLTNFALTGVQQLATETDSLSTQLQSLTQRVVALENATNMSTSSLAAAVAGATDTASSTSPTDLATTTVVNALSDMGVLLEKGIAQFNTLVVRDLVFSKDSDGTSAAGSGTVPAGETTVIIDNAHMLSSSQVSVTLTAPMTGNWYVTNKQDGSFQVTLSQTQTTDVTFDYLIIQTEGQIATSTPIGASNPGAFSISSWLASLFGGNSTSTGSDTNSTPTQPADNSGSTGESGTGSSSGTATSTSSSGITVTLTGDAAMSVDQGGVFTDPGATATDATGDDISSSIAETGSVDTNTPGMYTLTYTATDANGNTGSASRVVTVTAQLQLPPPTSGSGDSSSGSTSSGSSSSTSGSTSSDSSSSSSSSSSTGSSSASAPSAAPAASAPAPSAPAPATAPASSSSDTSASTGG